MRHLYYQKFDKNRISPLQRKVLTLKVFTFASEFLKIRIMEIKEYFEKEMFFENLPSIVFTPPSVPPVLGDRNPQGREDVTALQYCICPTCPSPAGGSLTHSQALALSKRARGVTALRCSEPLRFMVVGPSKPSPDIVRDGTALLQLASGLRHVVRDGTAWGKVDRIIEVLVLW